MKEARPWQVFEKETRVTDEAVVSRRLEFCSACPEYFSPTKQCKLCKCLMPVKARLLNGSCPIGKWGMVVPEHKPSDSVEFPTANWDRIYFMHIPKTGGNYVNKYLVQPFSPIANRYAIPTAVDHSTWGYRTDTSYTVSVVRDPVARTVSHFAHWARSVGHDVEVSEASLMQWVNTYWDFLSNYQSKFFVHDVAQKFDLSRLGLDEVFKKLAPTEDDVVARAEQVNLLLKSEDLSFETVNAAAIKMFEDFGLTPEVINYDERQTDNVGEGSKALLDNLSISARDRLANDLCPVDSAVHASDNLFFKA